MTFTYAPSSTPSDVTLVRWYIGDTDAGAAMFTDEEIQMQLAISNGNVQDASLAMLDSVLAKLAMQPDFSADWLKISYGGQIANLRVHIQNLRRRFGKTGLSSGGVNVYRTDSGATEEPLYDDTGWDDLYD